MKIEKLLSNKIALGALAFSGLYLVARSTGKAMGDVAYEAVQSINPANRGNVVYKAFNVVGDVGDDGKLDRSFSLGSWLYNVTHEDEIEAINREQAILNEEFERRYGGESYVMPDEFPMIVHPDGKVASPKRGRYFLGKNYDYQIQ